MIDQVLYQDFESYLKENEKLITHLEKNHSLLSEYVLPIKKALVFLRKLDELDEIDSEAQVIFEYGFNYLFENLEQIKLYLRQLNNDYELLDKMSLYIKIVFDLEELKFEIDKSETIDEDEKQNDINKIDEALQFFEDNIVPQIAINEFELDKYLNLYYDLQNKYTDLVFMSEAFKEYCSVYGI